MALINKITAVYLLIGSVLMPVVFTYSVGIKGVLYHILPFMITLIVDLIYFISAFRFLNNPDDRLNKVMFIGCMVLYSLQVEFNGFYFKNTIGPLVEIGINSNGGLYYFAKVKWGVVKILNGYNPTSDSIYLSLNLVHVLLLLIVIAGNQEKLKEG